MFFQPRKTYSQILDMRDLLTGKDGIREWSEFKEMAGNIFDTYNSSWLKAEYSTAIGQAQNAVHWNNIEKNKELLPYLQYEATEDELECEICTPFNGLLLRLMIQSGTYVCPRITTDADARFCRLTSMKKWN
jgi:hypothetical protein